jgi:hypothetical protein
LAKVRLREWENPASTNTAVINLCDFQIVGIEEFWILSLKIGLQVAVFP